jgi:hypothetical protein
MNDKYVFRSIEQTDDFLTISKGKLDDFVLKFNSDESNYEVILTLSKIEFVEFVMTLIELVDLTLKELNLNIHDLNKMIVKGDVIV